MQATNIKTINFSQKIQPDFVNSLRQKVNEYFADKNLSKKGNTTMWLKTVFMFSLLVTPYLLMILNVFPGIVPFFMLWIIMGFGMAGIGLSVMHDANHGSYSKNSNINKILGYSLNILGGNSYLWKIQHNYLHHAFTNIEDVDDDIHVPFFLRFSIHSEKHRIQQFQHIYIWFFYALSTLSWVTIKNFLQFFRYRNKGLIKDKKELITEIIKEVAWKILYYFVLIVIPVMVLPVPVFMIIIAFIAMHAILGLTLSAIFQPAHVMPSSEYPLPDDNGNMENNWAVHQLLTTCNFAPESRFFNWFVGGLNYQVEHHLFPNICHVHYRSISKIVKQTATEFGIPYNVEPTFFQAIRTHTGMLKFLGSGNDRYQSEKKPVAYESAIFGLKLDKQA